MRLLSHRQTCCSLNATAGTRLPPCTSPIPTCCALSNRDVGPCRFEYSRSIRASSDVWPSKYSSVSLSPDSVMSHTLHAMNMVEDPILPWRFVLSCCTSEMSVSTSTLLSLISSQECTQYIGIPPPAFRRPSARLSSTSQRLVCGPLGWDSSQSSLVIHVCLSCLGTEFHARSMFFMLAWCSRCVVLPL